ncbi:three component ABC system middle component [Nonomuraea soli]|uniref:three component ABC system middle component n=1 Tax=Nonomuraea soli TaxID=1032476 RepID=UPI001C66B615
MAVFESLSREERNLYNPAFAGLLVARTAQGYEEENGLGCHISLAVLAPVMALTAPVRTALPRTTSATPVNWIERESTARIHLQAAAPLLGPLVRDGLLLGLQAGALTLDGRRRIQAAKRIPKRITGGTPEVVQIQKASVFLGRWLSRAGDLPTIFTLLGVRP